MPRGNHSKTSQKRLMEEFHERHDIVVEGFQESYKNLTLKTQGQLKWATYFCPNARYVMHVDDDVFADVRSIVQHLISVTEKRTMICGKVFMPNVRREGKWAMSLDEYSGNKYPKSCVGWCFIMTQATANELYIASINTNLIHLEDIVFTGILREKIKGLKPQKLPNGENLCQHLGWPKDKPTIMKLQETWTKLNKNLNT